MRQRQLVVSFVIVVLGTTFLANQEGLTREALIKYFLLLSLGLGLAYYFGHKLLSSIQRKKGALRPNRSKWNELGSSDLACRESIGRWLKRNNPLDTPFQVKGLRGADNFKVGSGNLYLPLEERNRHLLIIAKTGSGKTTKAILPALYHDCLCGTRSTVVIDSKPEMFDKLVPMTAKYNPKKNIMLFNPLDRVRGLSWNILAKVEDDTDAKLIANTVITATDQPNAKADSPFFRNNALQLLNAMMSGLLHDNDDRLSMPRIHELLHGGKENLCAWLEASPHAIRNSRTFVELARSGSQNADTILSELGMRLAAWDLNAIRATTFFEEIDLESLVTRPTLFIVELRESEIEMLRPMANVIVIEVLRFLTKYAESCPGQKLPRPVGLVIDEFASALGRLPDIHVKLNTLRSRNVSIVAAIQSIAQIKANYEKDADSVIAGFNNKILMPMLDFQDAEWASKETGTMTVRFKSRNVNTSRRVVDNFANQSYGSHEQVQQRAVLTPDEIGRPNDGAATFFLPNTPAFQGHLVPFYENPTMLDAISTEGDFKLRDKPIEYEEKLPEPVVAQEAEPAEEAGPSREEVLAELEKIKGRLDWENTTGVAREWWEAFEQENSSKLELVLTLTQELLKREATISEFFMAYVYSNTESIEGNLAYLDKMKEEEKQKQALQAEAEPAAASA